MGKYDMDDVDPSLSKYERELGEREHIINECPIDIYCSSINPRWGYPHKLMSYWECRPSVAESAESLIIDSGFRRYGEMDEIIEAAKIQDADWFIPPDITPHFDEYDRVTPAERVTDAWEFGNQTENAGVDADMLVPLHRPVGRHIDELIHHESGNLLERFEGVAVGLKGIPVSERVEILGLINRRTPPDMHVHALSPGTEMGMLAFLRENPHMVDSLDVSTPENAPANNKIPDATWYQHRAKDHNDGASWFPTGTDVSTLRAMETTRIVLQLNYMLSPLCNDSEFQEVRATWADDGGRVPEDQAEAIADD